ncbi:hypothetical protein HK102_011339 [Quaeritorhiza haematococci]|nr:hypothetical protein HK102_011339 [Quaeritorhiza haematococci]
MSTSIHARIAASKCMSEETQVLSQQQPANTKHSDNVKMASYKRNASASVKTALASAAFLLLARRLATTSASPVPMPVASPQQLDDSGTNHQLFSGALFGITAPPVRGNVIDGFYVEGDPTDQMYDKVCDAINQSCALQKIACFEGIFDETPTASERRMKRDQETLPTASCDAQESDCLVFGRPDDDEWEEVGGGAGFTTTSEVGEAEEEDGSESGPEVMEVEEVPGSGSNESEEGDLEVQSEVPESVEVLEDGEPISEEGDSEVQPEVPEVVEVSEDGEPISEESPFRWEKRSVRRPRSTPESQSESESESHSGSDSEESE